MLVLTRADISRLIQMEPIIDAVEAAHAALAGGAAQMAIEAATALPGSSAVMLPMTAALGTPGIAGVKLLTDVPDNPTRALPSQHSTITVVDPVTGRCRAFLDGVEITRYRTAAASAVATRHLAAADVSTLGLVGAGAQARVHLLAMRAVRNFERVAIWSRSRATAVRFAEEHADCGLPITVLDTPEAVVRSADVLCTLTPAREPLVRGEWFSAGLHINAVGAPPRPDHREIDTTGILRSVLVVDDLKTATARSGELCIPVAEGAITVEHVHADLGQVVVGARPARIDAEQITLFDSVGLAIQDMAAVSHILALAESEGIGTEIDLHAQTEVAPRALKLVARADGASNRSPTF